MGTKILLFTFDYELFLGRQSGSVQKCLLDPTKRLLRIFDTHQIRNAIFFVDTTYLIRLKKMADLHENARKDWELIKNQLNEIAQKGHYIFPHLHPHWQDAVYDQTTNQWILSDITKYRFSSLSDFEREEVFDQSIQVLHDILDLVNSYAFAEGFRAGGWSLQPFETFRPYFKKHKIKFDFSLLPGKCQFTNAQYYDYRICPDKPVYRFGNKVEKEDTKGDFTEIAITTLRYPMMVATMDRCWQKVLWRLRNRSSGDGDGVIAKTLNGFEENEKQNKYLERASIELLNWATWPVYKKNIAKNNYMQFISHPKMLSGHNFFMLEKLLSWINRHYSIETDFKKALKI